MLLDSRRPRQHNRDEMERVASNRSIMERFASDRSIMERFTSDRTISEAHMTQDEEVDEAIKVLKAARARTKSVLVASEASQPTDEMYADAATTYASFNRLQVIVSSHRIRSDRSISQARLNEYRGTPASSDVDKPLVHTDDPIPSDVTIVDIIDNGEERSKPLCQCSLKLPDPIAMLAIAGISCAGVAARLKISADSGREKFFIEDPYFGANALGCAIMALCVGFKLNEVMPYTHAAVTVGFCGCLTTFSSVMETAMLSSARYGSTELIAGLSIPFVVYAVAFDIASTFAVTKMMPFEEKTLNVFKWADRAMVVVCVALGVLLPLLAHVSGTIEKGLIITWALAPIGSLPRYLLASLNGIVDGFPIGTILANCFAVAIDGGLSHVPKSNPWGGYAADGICGSLSTVSSWVNDTMVNRKKGSRVKLMAYIYAVMTVVFGIVIGYLITNGR
jgi:CrcB protein